MPPFVDWNVGMGRVCTVQLALRAVDRRELFQLNNRIKNSFVNMEIAFASMASSVRTLSVPMIKLEVRSEKSNFGTATVPVYLLIVG